MPRLIGIRIKNAEKLNTRLLLEQLRYAGVMGRYQRFMSDAPVELLYPPQGVSKRHWAEQNVARIRSFGIHAEIVEE